MSDKIDLNGYVAKMKFDERTKTNWQEQIDEITAQIRHLGVKNIQYAVTPYLHGEESHVAMLGRLYEEARDAIEDQSHHPDINAILTIIESSERFDVDDEQGLFRSALAKADIATPVDHES